MAYLKYRTDAARHLGAALKADPQFALGHVLRGYFNMLAYNTANVQGAAEALAEARKHAKRTTTREAAHIEALARWIDGDLDRMLDVWREHLRRPSARRAGLPPAPFQRLLARPAGHHAGRGRARVPALERRAAGLGHDAVVPLLRPRGGRQLHPGRGRRTRRRSRSIPATCGAPTPSPTCWRCRAGAARASTG